MSRALAPIPAAVPGRLKTITSLPPWLSSLVAAVSDLGASRVTIEGGIPARRVTTLPGHMMPTAEQRSLISALITERRRSFPSDPGPQETVAETIGLMLNAYAAQSLGAQSARAKVATYLLALEDMPAWAVQEAYRRWTLGEAGAHIPAEEYSFAPSTVRMRRLAQFCLDVAAGLRCRLERILEAEPEHALTEAETVAASERLVEMSKDIARAARMAPSPTSGRTPAEQDELSRSEAARGQRYCLENPLAEVAHDAA